MIRKIIIFLFCAILALAAHIYFEVNFPKLNKVFLETGKIAEGKALRILQVTDVHSKRDTGFILKSINENEIDIIVLTGDIIDSRSKDVEHVYEFIGKIAGTGKKIFYVSGNHEHSNPYNPDFAKRIGAMGVVVLDNGNQFLDFGGYKVNMCGVDDFHTGHSDLEMAVEGIDDSIYTVLLSHSPDIVIDRKDLFSDLVLSGHTHGGQIRFPIVGGIVSPGQGFFPKYQKGLYEVGRGTTLYIDSGYGTSTIPVRVLNRSQISLIEIRGSLD